MVAEATIAVCPEGSRMSRLKRMRPERLGATLGTDDGLSAGPGFCTGGEGLDVGGADTGTGAGVGGDGLGLLFG